MGLRKQHLLDTEGKIPLKKKSITSHLYQVFLASIHYILRGKTVYHITCMKNYQQKYHTEKQECLRSSFSSSDFIKLKHRKHTNISVMNKKKPTFLKTFDILLNSSNCFNSTERSGRLLKLFSDKLIQMSPSRFSGLFT